MSAYVINNWYSIVGWTVVHSIWQASLLGLLVWLGLRLARGQSASFRYRLGYAGLLLQLAVSVFTGHRLWAMARAQDIGSVDPVLERGVVVYATPYYSPLLQRDSVGWTEGLDRLGAWLEPHLGLIVGLWLLGLLFFLFRLSAGLLYLRRLRAQALPLDAFYGQVLRLASHLGIRRRVVLLESGFVSGPVLLGQLKPVILFPLGLINQLAPAEVEAILAHELAHLHRYDYWFNILQSLIETLYYYHPVVWWMSAQVRQEREHCCDDIAVALSVSSLTYAKALAGVEGYRQAVPTMAMAFGGGKTPLLHRIQRILQPNINQSDMREKFTVTGLLLCAALLFSFGAEWRGAYAHLASEAATLGLVDTLPQGKIKLSVDKNGKRIEASVEDGELKALKLDGAEVPEAELASYEAMVEELIADIPAPPAPPTPPVAPMPPMPPMPPTPPAPPAPGVRYEIKIDEDGRRTYFHDTDARAPRAPGQPATIEREKVIILEDGPGMTRYHIQEEGQSPARIRYEIEIDEDRTTLSREQRELMQESRKLSEMQIEIALEQARSQEHQARAHARARGLAEEERVLAEEVHVLAWHDGGPEEGDGPSILERVMLDRGLISDHKNYKMELSTESLRINGKRQSAEDHQMIKSLYERQQGSSMSGKSSISVNKRSN